jgi:hypothetical protein
MQISSTILEKFQSAVADMNHKVLPQELLKEVIGPLTVICTKYVRRAIIQRPIPMVARTKLHAALNVAFALSIRSLTATSTCESLVCHSLNDPPRALWAWPAYAVLCAHVANMDEDTSIFADEPQAVAAARCMFLLLDTPLPMSARTAEVMQLRSKLVLRTAAALSKSPALFTSTAASLAPRPPKSDTLPLEYPREGEGASTSHSTSHTTRLRSNLVRSAVAVVCHQQPASPGTPSEPVPHDCLYSDDALRSASHLWMTMLLSTPKVLMHHQLMREAISVAPERFYTPLLSMLHGKGTGDTITNLAALCALTMLMVGPSVQLPGSTQDIRMLRPCTVLRDPRMLQIYLAACTRTVSKAAVAAHPADTPEHDRVLLRVLSWPFTQSTFLLDLLQGAEVDMSTAMLHLGTSFSSSTKLPDGSFDGFDVLVALYHSWIMVRLLRERTPAVLCCGLCSSRH